MCSMSEGMHEECMKESGQTAASSWNCGCAGLHIIRVKEEGRKGCSLYSLYEVELFLGIV